MIKFMFIKILNDIIVINFIDYYLHNGLIFT
jgi:hypothetical protein